MKKLGNLMLELEDVLTDMVEGHDLQHGDVLALVNTYLEIHHPKAKEEYEDGTSPSFHYGPLKKS